MDETGFEGSREAMREFREASDRARGVVLADERDDIVQILTHCCNPGQASRPRTFAWQEQLADGASVD